MAIKSQIGIRALIISENCLIVVEHEKDKKRFMVFPGGGLEEGETIFEGAIREVKEETNLEVVPGRIVYTREIITGKNHGIEFYVLCRLSGGVLSLGIDPEHEDGNIILKDVHRISMNDFCSMTNWYPTELHSLIADDFKNKFSEYRFLGTVKF
ncbi:NUDIX hydrolase [Candidatus Wolfebacteria bacterium]|nr:NUDIX hydrolase [Candidatus Wolfebacteria bacterium]